MFCTKCGNKLKENQKFCSKCGNKVGNQNYSQQTDITNKSTFMGETNNLLAGRETFLKVKNNNVFTEMLNPSGRRNRTKYLICFAVLFFLYYMIDSKTGGKNASEFVKAVGAVAEALLLYICFVNLSKRVHDFNKAAFWAIPVFAISYVFYYLAPPFIIRDYLMSFSTDRNYLTIMLRLCLVLTALPHILVSLIKGTEGVNKYGSSEK